MTGALIVTAISNPILALLLCLGSHLALDMLPHFGFRDDSLPLRKFVPILLADMFLAFMVLVLIVFSGNNEALLIAFGGVVASSPDLLSIPYFIDSLRHKEHHFGVVQRFLGRIQWSETPPGLVVEVAWACGVGFLLLQSV